VLACDGLYDVFTNDEVVAFVKAEMTSHGDALKCCQVQIPAVIYVPFAIIMC
jgi:hypothetical protein